MSRIDTLARDTLPLSERRRRIESEPLPVNIAHLLEQAAATVGDHTVWNFFDSGREATYTEMTQRVHGLAHGLAALGVRKGTHVAVMLPNVEAFPVTWLAIGVLGAVMVPVNIGYQPRELAYVLNDSDAEYLVIDAARLDILAACRDRAEVSIPAQRTVVLGPVPEGSALPASARWETLAQPRPDRYRPPDPVGLDDLLNIQYTSGTTGFPKGCMLTQRYWLTSGKVNAFRDARRYRRILASTPFYYMDPQWLLLMTIYQRATLFVAARQSASRFTDWLRRFRIEFCLFPSLVFKQAPSADDAVSTVVRGNVYGVPREIHAAIEERFDFCAREAFGMTELGSAMFMPIEATDMVGSGSCGIPSPFRECEVVDSEGRVVPHGEIGELRVRGTGILVGYYNKPEATGESLRDGWFYTGDLFRRDERGYFYIVGRKKDMIRRSSENIAAREVESVLNGVDIVLESAVVGVPDETRGEEVKAFIVLKQEGVTNDQALARIIDACHAQLARFKVPRYFSFTAALPKTPSLKVAKQVLRTQVSNEPIYDRQLGHWLDEAAREARP